MMTRGVLGVWGCASVVSLLKDVRVLHPYANNPLIEQFFAHAGNVGISGCAAVVLMPLFGRLEQRTANGFSRLGRTSAAAVLGLALGAGVNALCDTQPGMNAVGKYLWHCEQSDPAQDGQFCTVDPGDFQYGTATTAIMGITLADWFGRPRREDEAAAAAQCTSAASPPSE